MSPAAAAGFKRTMLWYFLLAMSVAVLVIFLSSWFDSRQQPTILITVDASPEIMIDARGAVASPGVVVLQDGARMIDVIAASGGLTLDADISLINQSTRVYDGQMIVFPSRPPESSSGVDGLVNINIASQEELTQLPGIGDVLSSRIVTYREINGPFQSIDDLINVDGISPAMMETLRPLITVLSGE